MAHPRPHHYVMEPLHANSTAGPPAGVRGGQTALGCRVRVHSSPCLGSAPPPLCISCPPAAEKPGGASLFLHSDNANYSHNTSSEGQDGCGPSAHARVSTLLLMLVIKAVVRNDQMPSFAHAGLGGSGTSLSLLSYLKLPYL